jgi:hypothetical protein
MEEVLGVKSLEPGFSRVEIRLELAGLEWARGTVATPRGPIGVTSGLRGSSVTLPPGVEAEVILPKGRILMDGKPVKGELVEDGSRQRVVVKKAGRTVFATN